MRKYPRCNSYMTSSVKGGYGNYWLSYQCLCGYTTDDEQTVASDRTVYTENTMFASTSTIYSEERGAK